MNKKKGGGSPNGSVTKRGRQKLPSVQLKELICKECWKHCDKELERQKKIITKSESELIEKKFVITGLQADISKLRNDILTKDELLKKLEMQMNQENEEAESQIADLKERLESQQRQGDVTESETTDPPAEVGQLRHLLALEQQKTRNLEESQSKTMSLILSARNLLCPQSLPSQNGGSSSATTSPSGNSPRVNQLMENHPQIASWTSVSLGDQNHQDSTARSRDGGVTPTIVPIITHVESLCEQICQENQVSFPAQEEPASGPKDLDMPQLENVELELTDDANGRNLNLQTQNEEDRSSAEPPILEPMQVEDVETFPSLHLEVSSEGSVDDVVGADVLGTLPRVLEEGSPNEDHEIRSEEFQVVEDTADGASTEVPGLSDSILDLKRSEVVEDIGTEGPQEEGPGSFVKVHPTVSVEEPNRETHTDVELGDKSARDEVVEEECSLDENAGKDNKGITRSEDIEKEPTEESPADKDPGRCLRDKIMSNTYWDVVPGNESPRDDVTDPDQNHGEDSSISENTNQVNISPEENLQHSMDQTVEAGTQEVEEKTTEVTSASKKGTRLERVNLFDRLGAVLKTGTDVSQDEKSGSCRSSTVDEVVVDGEFAAPTESRANTNAGLPRHGINASRPLPTSTKSPRSLLSLAKRCVEKMRPEQLPLVDTLADQGLGNSDPKKFFLSQVGLGENRGTVPLSTNPRRRVVHVVIPVNLHSDNDHMTRRSVPSGKDIIDPDSNSVPVTTTLSTVTTCTASFSQTPGSGFTAKISTGPDLKLRQPVTYTTIMPPKRNPQPTEKLLASGILATKGLELQDNAVMRRKPENLPPSATEKLVRHVCPVHGNVTKKIHSPKKSKLASKPLDSGFTPVQEKMTSPVPKNLSSMIEQVELEVEEQAPRGKRSRGLLPSVREVPTPPQNACPVPFSDHSYLKSPTPSSDPDKDTTESPALDAKETALKGSSSSKRKRSKPVKLSRDADGSPVISVLAIAMPFPFKRDSDSESSQWSTMQSKIKEFAPKLSKDTGVNKFPALSSSGKGVDSDELALSSKKSKSDKNVTGLEENAEKKQGKRKKSHQRGTKTNDIVLDSNESSPVSNKGKNKKIGSRDGNKSGDSSLSVGKPTQRSRFSPRKRENLSHEEYEKKLNKAAEKCLAPNEVPSSNCVAFPSMDIEDASADATQMKDTTATSGSMPETNIMPETTNNTLDVGSPSELTTSTPVPFILETPLPTTETRGEKRRRIAAVMATLDKRKSPAKQKSPPKPESPPRKVASPVKEDAHASGVPLSAVEELFNEMSADGYGEKDDDIVAKYFHPSDFEKFPESVVRCLKNVKNNYTTMLQYGLPVEKPDFMKKQIPTYSPRRPAINSLRKTSTIFPKESLQCSLCSPRRVTMFFNDQTDLAMHIYEKHRDMDPKVVAHAMELLAIKTEPPSVQSLQLTPLDRRTKKPKKRIPYSPLHNFTAPKQESVKCDICEKMFASKVSLSLHMKRHTEKTIECEWPGCEKKFHIRSDMMRHMRRHTGEKPYRCKECGKVFAQLSHLQVHERTHTGAKPYLCVLCSASFSQRAHLKSHLATHTGEKRFFCDIKGCGKAFFLKEKLELHYATHTGEKNHVCEECGKRFNHISNLQKHLRIHAGDRRHPCLYCEKKFYTATDLKIHIRTHSGERPYMCEICQKSFVTISNLRKHEVTHKEYRKFYDCSECGAKYSSFWNYNRHKEMRCSFAGMLADRETSSH